MIHNEFWNIVRFIPAMTETKINSGFFDVQEYPLGTLIAEKGDFWRFLFPKSDLQNTEFSKVNPYLIKYEWLAEQEGKVTVNFPNEPTKVGLIRKQKCEEYTELKLIVNSVPNGTIHKQFALLRSNGTTVFPTFVSQETNKLNYLRALQKHLEEFWAANVFVDLDGNILTVRVYNNARFFLTDEVCTIGIGKTEELNTNNPLIDITEIGTITIIAKYSYTLTVKNIAIGNVLTLGNVTVTVKLGDTEESIKNTLLAGQSLFVVNQADFFNKISDLGSYEVSNSIKPLVIALLQSSSGGYDHYLINVSGQFVEGNIIQVLSDGKPPILVTVSATDTLATLTSLLNPDSSQYNAIAGHLVTINVLEGAKTIQNTNNLVFELGDRVSINSVNVKRYQLHINDDVQLRNEFVVNDKKYIAKANDTGLTVAKALGYTTQSFIVDMPLDETLIAYASKGLKYGDENIADVKILSQPKVQTSSQYIAEVEFPTDIQSGAWLLALYNEIEGICIGVSNPIIVGSKSPTLLIEFADKGIVFGHEYFEKGLSQKIRIPACLSVPFRETEENRTIRVDGGYIRNETNIREYRNLVTDGINTQLMRAIQVAFRHKVLIINNDFYYAEGEIRDDYVDEYIDFGQNMSKLFRQGKISNITKTLNINTLNTKFCKVSLDFANVGLRIIIKGLNFETLLNETANVPVGEYDLIIDNTSDKVGLDIYENDTLKRRVILDKYSRNRLRNYVRFDDSVKIRGQVLKSDVQVQEWINEPVNLTVEVNHYTPEIVYHDLYNEFSDDFNDDFKR